MSAEKRRQSHADASMAHATLSIADADTTGALDLSGFADAMASLAATVCIATAAEGDERYGRTVTAVTSLAPNPPTLLVSITRDSDLARLIIRTGRFSLSLLAEGQEVVGDAFAGKGKLADRFAVGTWETWPSGQPKLAGAATLIECRVAGCIDLDTRCVFIGILTGSETGRRPPLLWYERDYHALAPKL